MPDTYLPKKKKKKKDRIQRISSGPRKTESKVLVDVWFLHNRTTKVPHADRECEDRYRLEKHITGPV